MDFEALTQINKDILMQQAWERAKLGNYLDAQGIPESFYDDLPESLKRTININAHGGSIFSNNSQTNALRTLGLPEYSIPTAKQIKDNYRKLAMQYHPDRNKGNQEAETKFKEVSEAYKEVANQHDRAEKDAVAIEEKLKAHFAVHEHTSGWADTHFTDRQTAAFPIEHLSFDQKHDLMDTLRDEGYNFGERISPELGKVLIISNKAQENVDAKEIAHKLQMIFTGKSKCAPVPPLSTGITNEAERVVEEAANLGKNAAKQSGNKMAWVFAGSVAIVAIGGAIFIKKKEHAAREKDRQKNIAATTHGI